MTKNHPRHGFELFTLIFTLILCFFVPLKWYMLPTTYFLGKRTQMDRKQTYFRAQVLPLKMHILRQKSASILMECVLNGKLVT